VLCYQRNDHFHDRWEGISLGHVFRLQIESIHHEWVLLLVAEYIHNENNSRRLAHRRRRLHTDRQRSVS